MIDIMMLSCNRKRITRTSIEGIQRRTTTPHKLTVLDNGSVDGSTKMLVDMEVDGVIDRVIVSGDNKGVHWGFNRLLDLVMDPFYVCTDNDIIPPYSIEEGDWLSRLLMLMDEHDDYAAIACRPHIMIGDNHERMFRDAPPVRERGHVGAVLRLMRTDAVREVGGWKKDVRPSRNNEEWYICGKLREVGWKVGYSRDVRIIHLFGEGENEDPWGYPLGVEHGHVARWPPVNHYSWERMGIDWEKCLPVMS